MEDRNKIISAYFLRVDESTGTPYQGYIGTINNTLRAEQEYVNFGRSGGLIQVIHLNDELDMICHDEGKFLGFPFNRALVDQTGAILDVVVGNILVVRHRGIQFSSIFAEDIPYVEKCLIPVRYVKKIGFLQLPSSILPKWERGT